MWGLEFRLKGYEYDSHETQRGPFNEPFSVCTDPTGIGFRVQGTYEKPVSRRDEGRNDVKQCSKLKQNLSPAAAHQDPPTSAMTRLLRES